jgi:hypothetical protein
MRISTLSFCLVLVALGTSPRFSQNRTPESAGEAKLKVDDTLKIEAKVVGQKYCHVDSETFSVLLSLKIKFTNVSDHPVILARKIVDPPIVHVAQSIETAEKGEFEYDPNYDYFPQELPVPPRFGDAPDAKHFVVLSRTETYEAMTSTYVVGAFAVSFANKRGPFLEKGSHVLQVGVEVWPYQWPHFRSDGNTHDLELRWETYGHLANGIVYSDFVPFTIPDQFENPQCPLKP